MKKIEQNKADMVEIYNKVIYPGFGCAAVVDLQVKSLEVLKDSLERESTNKELNRVLSYSLKKVIKDLEGVRDTLNSTMSDTLASLAPADFIIELHNRITK